MTTLKTFLLFQSGLHLHPAQHRLGVQQNQATPGTSRLTATEQHLHQRLHLHQCQTAEVLCSSSSRLWSVDQDQQQFCRPVPCVAGCFLPGQNLCLYCKTAERLRLVEFSPLRSHPPVLVLQVLPDGSGQPPGPVSV